MSGDDVVVGVLERDEFSIVIVDGGKQSFVVQCIVFVSVQCGFAECCVLEFVSELFRESLVVVVDIFLLPRGNWYFSFLRRSSWYLLSLRRGNLSFLRRGNLSFLRRDS